MTTDRVSNGELRAAIAADIAIANIWPRVGLAGYRGSLAHGMAGDILDDIDIMGVFVAPPNHYLGLTKLDGIERPPKNSKFDFVLYEITKFIRLLLKGNPNVLCMLWLEENSYIHRTDWAKKLIENRDIFLSKQLYKSFSGYAYGQLKRMTHPNFEGYQSSKRRERFQQYGFDCKNASTLIRLMRMGIEALTTSEVIVLRHDAAQLLEIKRGEWTKEQVEKEADRLGKLMEEALVRSSLPNRPDYQKAEEIVVDIVKAELF